MGRTKRIRKRRRSNYLEPDIRVRILALMKWMRTFEWRNKSEIHCRIFEGTGRGVTSRKKLSVGDCLIKVPYELMITYSTLSDSEEFKKIFKTDSKLGIHDILAAFLVIEKHKKNQSFWKYYLESLPTVAPDLPWFSSSEEIAFLPYELRNECEKCRTNFEDSWTRIRCSISTGFKCACCARNVEEILTLKSYAWGYTMVNTRSVYVDPAVIRNYSNWDIIIDEPQLAMFPLMDMINHSDVAENKIEFQETSKGLFYQLSTLNNCESYEQIFISYGRHDNTKLFSEYGFYLPQNSNNKIKFTPKEILNWLNLKLDNFQFDFMKRHEFLDREELFISSIGPSFKLKGFLYVALNDEKKNYSACIFSQVYDEYFLKILPKCLEKLLDMKVEEYKSDYWKFRNQFESNVDVCRFLELRVLEVENLRGEINVCN